MKPEPEVGRPHRAREETTQHALETVAEGGPLAGVLEFLCRTMEAESDDRVIACIHPVNGDATTFCDTAAPSLGRGYCTRSNGVKVSSLIGPCCYAVISRQTVIAANIEDAKWRKFRQFAEPLGIRSCWSTPIFSSDRKVLGTFAHYYFDARDPSSHDERMVDLLARAAAVAIERSRAEAALRELNETLEERVQAETHERLQIWNVSEDLLVIAGQDGKYLSVNPAWTATFGWSEGDLLGRSYQSLLHPDDQERTRMEFDRLVKDQKPVRFENRLRAKDGSYHWISWKAAPDGERVYGVGRDITESKRAQDALNKAAVELARVSRVTALSALTASIAHEVNQPLSGVITNVSTCLRMLDAAPPNVDGARETSRRALRDANRASQVISRLRALFSNREFALETLDINELTREVVALSLGDLQRHRIALLTDYATDLPSITGDRIQLQQVILNLLRNAVDAMVSVRDRARHLLIRTACGDIGVRLTVKDAGVGLDIQTMNKLFDAFFTTKTDGMGIGLAVSQSIIEKHHGRLWAEPNDGPGATFIFSIPSEPVEASDTAAERMPRINLDRHEFTGHLGLPT
jgi:PAS domain S-box-containing protein